MGSPKRIRDDQEDAVRLLHEYYSAFSTLNVAAVLPYFHEPSLLMGPQGVFAATTHALLAAIISPTMDGFRDRGLSRTELRVLNLKSLSATAMSVLGIARRYKSDGDQLDQVGVTYVMHKGDHGWKIAVVILHDPPADAVE
jgi:ketosteroid isomerase-like protein